MHAMKKYATNFDALCDQALYLFRTREPVPPFLHNVKKYSVFNMSRLFRWAAFTSGFHDGLQCEPSFAGDMYARVAKTWNHSDIKISVQSTRRIS
jgi:hypothetical protein